MYFGTLSIPTGLWEIVFASGVSSHCDLDEEPTRQVEAASFEMSPSR